MVFKGATHGIRVRVWTAEPKLGELCRLTRAAPCGVSRNFLASI
jgi:hypothetical protein